MNISDLVTLEGIIKMLRQDVENFNFNISKRITKLEEDYSILHEKQKNLTRHLDYYVDNLIDKNRAFVEKIEKLEQDFATANFDRGNRIAQLETEIKEINRRLSALCGTDNVFYHGESEWQKNITEKLEKIESQFSQKIAQKESKLSPDCLHDDINSEFQILKPGFYKFENSEVFYLSDDGMKSIKVKPQKYEVLTDNELKDNPCVEEYQETENLSNQENLNNSKLYSFEQAILALKKGYRIKRKGWSESFNLDDFKYRTLMFYKEPIISNDWQIENYNPKPKLKLWIGIDNDGKKDGYYTTGTAYTTKQAVEDEEINWNKIIPIEVDFDEMD